MLALLQFIDSGLEAAYSLPAGLGATAALAILAPESASIDWVGRDLELEWVGAAAADDTVLVEATLLALSERRARFGLTAKSGTQSPLYRGTMRFIAVRGGIPEGFRSADDCEAVRTSLSLLKATPVVGPGKLVVGPGKLKVLRAPRSIQLGRSAVVELEVVNTTDDTVTVAVEAHLPFGAGLSLDGPKIQSPMIESHRRCCVTFSVRADRPHEVNLGKPWILRFTAGTDCVSAEIAVPDPRPGRTFYLLTEDCETFDGGPQTGDYARFGIEVFGNQNDFMDPEDYRIQMVEKPNRMNEIAHRHGARWTHFCAITQLFAAEWAARQSTTGEWNKVVAQIKASIRAGSTDHEYAPHIHFDYEPESNLPPQPRLIYDETTDGILPNDYYDPDSTRTIVTTIGMGRLAATPI